MLSTLTASAETLDTSTEPEASVPEVSVPEISAEAAILIDATTGEVLYEKNSDQKMFPASITKLMTMLLALEHGALSDSIPFSHEAVYSNEAGGAHISIQEDEILTLEQCLMGIILRSANEVSSAVAEYVDGSIDAFATHMTARAKELGATNTNFLNANGLHNENHYTTAHDMALIAKELLTMDDYRQLMSITDYDIEPTNLQKEVRNLHGQHQMLNKPSLYYYEYAIGGKTGFTSEAQNTLVTYAKKGDTELIVVVLHCSGAEHYVDSKALFEYGFQNYQTAKLLSANDYVYQIPVTQTNKNKTETLATISVTPEEDVYKTISANSDVTNLDFVVDVPESIEAPVALGDSVGTVLIKQGDTVLGTAKLVAQKEVTAITDAEYTQREQEAQSLLFKTIGKYAGIFVLCLVILLCITRTIGHYKREQNRKLRRRRRLENGTARPRPRPRPRNRTRN